MSIVLFSTIFLLCLTIENDGCEIYEIFSNIVNFRSKWYKNAGSGGYFVPFVPEVSANKGER